MASINNDFKGVVFVGNTYLMNRLEINLKTWFDWAFLRGGWWTDVNVPTLGAFGGDFSILRAVTDPSFTTGTVYESARKDWVWETGVDHVDFDGSTQNPTSPALTYVGGVLTAPDHINYPLGRVVFGSAQSTSAVITAKYSYRNTQVYRANDTPWWRELQYKSFRVDDSHFSQLDNGVWAVGSQHRVQMPCVIIEAVPRAVSRGFQLGDGSAIVEQDVLVHILAENGSDRNKLVDIFRGQFDKVMWLFDNDLVAQNTEYPLDHEGDIVDSAQTYEALVDVSTGRRWEKCRFSRTEVAEVESLNSRLYEGVVRMTCEVVLDD